MLLSEMVRRIEDEEELFVDVNTYRRDTSTDWLTVVSRNIQMNKSAIIHFGFELYYYSSPVAGSDAYGNARLLVDGVPVCSTGEQGCSNGGEGLAIRSGYIVLEAGSHTFEFQLSGYFFDQGFIMLQNCQLRKLGFSDAKASWIDSGYISAPNAVETTIIDQNIVLPQRKSVAGTLKEIPIQAIVYMEQQNLRNSILLNPGEANVSGKLNWKIYIDDVQVAWNERKGDFDTGQTWNHSYAEGAYGLCRILRGAGETINIKVKVHNATTGAVPVRAILNLFACPWIIPEGEYQPLNLSFPQGSTLYVTLEPLRSNPIKTLKLGKRRAWSYGDATDYYSTASGAGILDWSYTFERIEVSSCLLLISGNGGCISNIAVDVR